MQIISKLEKLVLGWAKDVPHLPVAVQKWLGTNVWWIALIGAILNGISLLVTMGALFTLIEILGTPSSTYHIAGNYNGLAILSAAVNLVFIAINGLLLAFAVKPLQLKHKKGWVLLFFTLLVQAVSVVVSAILSLSILGFIIGILFGTIFLAVSAYFIFEIHGQFNHALKATIRKS